jgi:hypothetical protein
MLRSFANNVETHFGTTIKHIRSNNGRKYISNEFKEFFLRDRGIYQLTTPSVPESNVIILLLKQSITMIARSITIDHPDFARPRGEAINMAARFKTRLPYKYLTSLTMSYEHVRSNRPTISQLKPFESK